MTPRPLALADPTDAELAFRHSSGRLSLDFVMTVGERQVRPHERLRRPIDLARWTVFAGLMDDEPPVTARQLADGRVLREAIHRLVRAAMGDEAPKSADIEQVNLWASRPDLAPQLGQDGTVHHRAGRRPIEACLASVARDAVRLLGEEDPSRLRECEGEECGGLFLDTSRAGNRRWCTDGTCGNRSRVAGYRRRHS